MEDIGERKTVLLGKRNVDAVVGGCRLQFEVERAAEALAQSQTPGFVDPCSERGMDDQLHAAAFIKESFGDDRLQGRHRAEHGAPAHDVFDQLLSRGIVEAALRFQPLDRALHFF